MNNELDEIVSAVSSDSVEILDNLYELEQFEIKPNVETPKNDKANGSSEPSTPQGTPPTNASQTDTNTTEPLGNTNESTIDAKAMIELADVILSRLCVVGLSMMDYKSSVTDFKLSSDEKKKLEPVAGRLLNKYSLGLPDEWLLALLVLAIYGGKIVSQMDSDNKIQRTKKPSSSTIHTGEKRGRGRPPKQI